jgi:hypothetical protein
VPTVTGVLPKSKGDANQEISADGGPDHRVTGASGAGAVRRSPRDEEDSECDQGSDDAQDVVPLRWWQETVDGTARKEAEYEKLQVGHPEHESVGARRGGISVDVEAATPTTAWVMCCEAS